MSKNSTSYPDPFGILPNLWEEDSDSPPTNGKKKVAFDGEDDFEFDDEFDEKFEALLEDVCLTYGKKSKQNSTSYQARSRPTPSHQYQDGKGGWAKPIGPIQVWPGSGLDPETISDYWVPVTTYEGKPVFWTIRRPQTPPHAPYVPEGGYQYRTPPRSPEMLRSNLSPYAKPFQPRTPQR